MLVQIRTGSRLARLLVLLQVTAWSWAVAQDEGEGERGWSNGTELSVVMTSGNAETTTFGFKNRLSRTWDAAELRFDVSGLRAESTDVSRFATGTPDDFVVVESETTDVTDEKYSIGGAYDRHVTERLLWNVQAGWDRNRSAGVLNRWVVSVGAGHRWWRGESGRWRTGYGLSFTDQEDEIFDPDRDDRFLGVRLTSDFEQEFLGDSTYANVLVFDQSLGESQNWRFDLLNSVAVSMSERLALKLSLQLLFDNDPSLVEVALLGPNGDPTGEVVAIDADELDTVFNVALVVDF